jgi:hypothetical protein
MEENREFHGEEFFKWMVTEYNNLREYRNKLSASLRGKPDAATLEILKVNKSLEDWFHSEIYLSREQRAIAKLQKIISNQPKQLKLF